MLVLSPSFCRVTACIVQCATTGRAHRTIALCLHYLSIKVDNHIRVPSNESSPLSAQSSADPLRLDGGTRNGRCPTQWLRDGDARDESLVRTYRRATRELVGARSSSVGL